MLGQNINARLFWNNVSFFTSHKLREKYKSQNKGALLFLFVKTNKMDTGSDF